MAKTIDPDPARPDGGSVVPHIPPETLHRLVLHQGLEACAELVTAATPAQLAALLDLDLWRPARPGRDDRFDVERFGEWVEVLVGIDDSVAARTVAGLDRDVVVTGLSRYVRVLDPGIFEPTEPSDDEPPDRDEAMREGDSVDVDAPANDTGLECEVGGYLVRARRSNAWDATVALLAALDAEHPSAFHAVMQGCRRLSNSRSEIDGLDDLLAAPEQHLHDVTVDREGRRSRQGYATPADARAFLEMARRSAGAGRVERNPIVTAYFRATDEAMESPGGGEAHAPVPGAPASLGAVPELLAEAGVMPERPRARLAGASADPKAARLPVLRRLMEHVRDAHAAAYDARGRELAFLANALLEGGSVQSRSFTPREASDAAAAVCNLGLEHWPGNAPDALLVDHDLVHAFEMGWWVLHRDVSLFAADQLIQVLADVRPNDRDTRQGLAALRRALLEQRAAGTPWRARGAAEVLAALDTTAWVGVLGLLDECPVLAAALTAVVERRTTTVRPTEFEFISTSAQIAQARTFMRTLPDILFADLSVDSVV